MGHCLEHSSDYPDLDSLVSSIAFSVLSSTLLADRVVPLTLTPSNLMHLRPENLLAFDMANKLDPEVILHPDTLPLDSTSPSSLSRLGELGATFALVDHNRLLPQFGQGTVTAIIDHHDDELAHLDAPLRIITVPTGSCASLVATHFKPQWEASLRSPAGQAGSPVPREVATLLLEATLIDTAGLKAGGKATPIDYEAAEFLYPLSTLADPSSDSVVAQSSTETLANVYGSLSDAKFNVSALNTNDLLIRDYKEYTLPTSSVTYPTLRAGLSTVPLGLKEWFEKESSGWESLVSAIDGYMAQRNLDIEGVLTSYNNKQGKHRRELLLVTKTGNAFKTPEEASRVMQELIAGLEASSELSLAEWTKDSSEALQERKSLDDESSGRFGKVWKQQNAKATRKQVAPLLREVISQVV